MLQQMPLLTLLYFAEEARMPLDIPKDFTKGLRSNYLLGPLASARVSGVQQMCKRTSQRGRFFPSKTKSIYLGSGDCPATCER